MMLGESSSRTATSAVAARVPVPVLSKTVRQTPQHLSTSKLTPGTARTIWCSYSTLDSVEQSAADSNEDVEFSTMTLAAGAVDALFKYPPFFRFAAGRARKMIIDRGEAIGYPWPPTLAKLRAHDWDQEMKRARSTYVQYPDYYLKPFHAYENGNLSWDAAWEVELAAKSVHANTFDPKRKLLDPEGDVKLRNAYHSTMIPLLKTQPQAVVDIGCSTGLSTFGLHEIFPSAFTVGVDLSPYFISVANFNKRELGKSNSVQFLHAPGEYTGLPSASYDLVSLCLVCHELPRSATKQIIEEAHRLLKRGGALAIMEMNPHSVHLQSMVKNVFAFTAFKATEPYFNDYRTFSIEEAITQRGFSSPVQTPCSPRHRTIVAHKK